MAPDEADTARPALVPELYVSSLTESLRFYVGLLGFRVDYERPEDRFVSLCLEGVALMLEEAPSLERATPEEFARGEWRSAELERPFGRGMNLEIRVTELEPVVTRRAAAGHPLLLAPHKRSYRVGEEQRIVRQLLVADPDGYLLRLSQPLRDEA